MSKKVVRLVDNRAVTGSMVRELRSAIRAIEDGSITGMAFVALTREGNIKTRFNCECSVKMMGGVELLRDYIRHKSFELS